jgi:hypothetical protein
MVDGGELPDLAAGRAGQNDLGQGLVNGQPDAAVGRAAQCPLLE